MTNRTIRKILIVVMIVCAIGTLAYPVRMVIEERAIEQGIDELRALRAAGMQTAETAEPQIDDNNGGPVDRGTAEEPTGSAAETQTDQNDEIRTEITDERNDAPAQDDTAAAETSAAKDAATETAEKAADVNGTADAGEAVSGDTETYPDANVKESENVAAEKVTPTNKTSGEKKADVQNTAAPEAGTAQGGAASDKLTAALKDDAGNESALQLMLTMGTYDDEAEETVTDGAETADVTAEQPEAEEVPDAEPIDRFKRTTTDSYFEKEKVEFDPDKILPQYREIYALNNDTVGWLSIPGVSVDYPVLQNDDPEYYLDNDFYGKHNRNGQLIMDTACDPWTPSYNLVISGHNTPDSVMFGDLTEYNREDFWQTHKTLTFDTLMREGTYVIFAAFRSADYDDDEEGFRYNADLKYKRDVEMWLAEVAENRMYDTGIDAEYGDEFLTLSTCFYQRRNGRFVVVARRLREGEVIE